MILPLVVILSLIVLTSLGFWYRKAIVQSFLSERLIAQRIRYNECKSLMPILKHKLDDVAEDDLKHEDETFLTVSVAGKEQWQVGRSKLQSGKVTFTFTTAGSFQEPIRLTLPYDLPEN